MPFLPNTRPIQIVERLRWGLPILILLFVVGELFVEQRFIDPLGPNARFTTSVLVYGLIGPMVTWWVLTWIAANLRRQEAAEEQIRLLNRELEELAQVLPQCVDILKPGGRLVVISFHSLEDRMVKQFMRKAASADELPRGVPLRQSELKRFSKQSLRVVGKAIRPGALEVAENVRARSAVMRVAEKIQFDGSAECLS